MGNEKQELEEINIEDLKIGMLLDRPIFIYLSGQKRYVKFINNLFPLESKNLEKLQKIGKAYSNSPAIEKRFTPLKDTAETLKKICSDDKLAPFEKNESILKILPWLDRYIFGEPNEKDLTPVLFFIYRALETPNGETLEYLCNLSVDGYEESLKIATLSGLLALALGYNDFDFLKEYIHTCFCVEIGFYTQQGQYKQESTYRRKSLELIESGSVPGVTHLDHRFASLIAPPMISGEELHEIFNIARFIQNADKIKQDTVFQTRTMRKISKIFRIDKLKELHAA